MKTMDETMENLVDNIGTCGCGALNAHTYKLVAIVIKILKK